VELEARKRSLRARVSRLRSAAANRPDAAGRSVAGLIEATVEFANASRIALYAALSDELPTRALFDLASAAGKRCAFPASRKGGALEFRIVDRWEDLAPGRYGVLEPADPSGPIVALGRPDLVLVPGVAFDPAGNRLGRGRGYYDRAFPADAADGPVLFGLAFELQIVDEVPHGPLDRRMDAVVSERGLRRAGGAARQGQRKGDD